MSPRPSKAPKKIPERKFCRNSWKFEGEVIQPPEEWPTRTGRARAWLFVRDRPRVRGESRWWDYTTLRAVAFDEFAEDALQRRVGSRLLLFGNFANPPQTSWQRHLAYPIVTGIREISGEGSTFINEWEFEGCVAAPPVRTFRCYGQIWGQLNLWQNSVKSQLKGQAPRFAKPALLNTLVRSVTLREQLLSFEKGDDIHAFGRLISSPYGHMARALTERASLIDRDVADQRLRRRVTDPFVTLGGP